MPNKRKPKQKKRPASDRSPAEQQAPRGAKSPANRRAQKLTVEQARARLLDQFEALRTSTQDVIEQVNLRLTAQLAEASRRLVGNGGLDAPPCAVSSKTGARMSGVLRKLRLKPKKGRLKDLARIERAVGELLELTEPKS